MRLSYYISAIGILIIVSCSSPGNYYVTKQFKTIIDNNNCQIAYYYPRVQSSNLEFKKVNEILEKLPDYNYHSNNCNDSRFSKQIIKGDYKVLFQNSERLSIEFTKKFHRDSISKIDEMISGLVINPIELESNETKGLVNITSIIPSFKRGSLYKYVKEYNEVEGASINLKAYEENSNYNINWAITNEELIVYLGGEGEFFGFDKIEIPISKLREENDL